jgi:hypothetical protein
VWIRGWPETETKRRAANPEARLLAIFDVFDGWFRKKSSEGCSFINVLLESNASSPLRQAASNHLAKYARSSMTWPSKQDCVSPRNLHNGIC